MTNDAKDIINGLELIHMCCETIEECGGCDYCPMGSDCFEYNSLLDSYENISVGKWEEFIKERNMTRNERRQLEWED